MKNDKDMEKLKGLTKDELLALKARLATSLSRLKLVNFTTNELVEINALKDAELRKRLVYRKRFAHIVKKINQVSQDFRWEYPRVLELLYLSFFDYMLGTKEQAENYKFLVSNKLNFLNSLDSKSLRALKQHMGNYLSYIKENRAKFDEMEKNARERMAALPISVQPNYLLLERAIAFAKKKTRENFPIEEVAFAPTLGKNWTDSYQALSKYSKVKKEIRMREKKERIDYLLDLILG